MYVNGNRTGSGTYPALTYLGTYDASTNTPTLVNGTGTAGDWYRTTVAGTNNPTGTLLEVNQEIIYNGTIWQAGAITDNTDEFIVAAGLSPSNIPIASGQTGTQAFGAAQGQIESKAANNAVVHLTGDETVNGTKTFQQEIIGDISGNAGTVTDGIYTTDTTDILPQGADNWYATEDGGTSDNLVTLPTIVNLQDQIDNLDADVTLQDAFDNGNIINQGASVPIIRKVTINGEITLEKIEYDVTSPTVPLAIDFKQLSAVDASGLGYQYLVERSIYWDSTTENSKFSRVISMYEGGAANIQGDYWAVDNRYNQIEAFRRLTIQTEADSSTVIAADPSSVLDVVSTIFGARPAPSMTATQRDGIVSPPVAGLQVFNTDTKELNLFDGTAWYRLPKGDTVINGMTASCVFATSVSVITSFESRNGSLVTGSAFIQFTPTIGSPALILTVSFGGFNAPGQARGSGNVGRVTGEATGDGSVSQVTSVSGQGISIPLIISNTAVPHYCQINFTYEVIT